jgi:hypothetical protein
MKYFIQKHQELIIICTVGLVIRLIIMPFAQSNDSDAACRVFIARGLLENFRLLMSGHWAPISHYFNALSLFIIPGNTYGPMVFNILFAVASCIPLYFFTAAEFNKRGALFVALIYTFSPVVFKNSFMAMAEISYAFFVLLSMYFLSKGIRSIQKIKYAIYAGISITVAGGIRYEAWEVMGLFFIVLVLFKQWKMLIPFGVAALIFPTYWMIGNQIEQKDFLYCFHYATYWTKAYSGYNENVTHAEKIKRLVFFPLSWVLMLTPFISLILTFTFLKYIFSRKISKTVLIWSVPFFIIMITYIYTAYKGTLFTQHRFTITLILFSVPFFALFFENERHIKLKKAIVYLLIALMVPLSFYWYKIPIYKIEKISHSLFWALENGLIIEKNDAIPFIRDKSAEVLLRGINSQLNDNKGLILDFIGWEETYFIALNTGKSNRNIYIYNFNSLELDTNFINNFVIEYPNGLIMLKAFSAFDNICHSQGAVMEIEHIHYPFYLEKCLDTNNIKLFRYYVKSKEWAENYKLKNPMAIGITKTIKDIKYYENGMRNNPDWLNDVEKKAKSRNLSIDEMIHLDAQYMVDQDIINSRIDSLAKQK